MSSFFDVVRKKFGKLSQSQVDGYNILLDATKDLPIPYRAYILATAYYETAHTMQPIEEYGHGRGHPYGKPTGPYNKIYYGRGYVQLTWGYNYQFAQNKLSVPLYEHPELALDPHVASRIIVEGMTEGWFTGKKLRDYSNYYDMRKTVNGLDKADLIASYAETFEEAIKLDPEPFPIPGDKKTLLDYILDLINYFIKRKN